MQKGTSNRTSTSRLKASPGTGTLSTWCGWVCLLSFTGCSADLELRSLPGGFERMLRTDPVWFDDPEAVQHKKQREEPYRKTNPQGQGFYRSIGATAIFDHIEERGAKAV